MNTPAPAVSEDELHAYVDGQLAAARLDAVRRYLDANPGEAARIAAYAAQRTALRAAYALRPDEPLPSALRVTRLLEERHQRRIARWRIAAAIVLALGLGGTGGWLLRAPAKPSRVAQAMSLLGQQALATYTVYAPEKLHPVEVWAAERDHLAHWLSTRLDRTVAPPRLEGFGLALIGGRLVATEHGGAAALLLYQDDRGNRIGLLLRPMAAGLRHEQTDMRRGSVNGCAWIGHGMGYALVGGISDRDLDRIADQIRAEMAPARPG